MITEAEAKTFLGKEIEWEDNRPTPDRGGDGLRGGIGRLAGVTARDAVLDVFDNYARVPTKVHVPLTNITMRVRSTL